MSTITIDKDTLVPCQWCGEIATHEADERYCDACFAANELENEHEDGNHDEPGYFDAACRYCNDGTLSATQRRVADEPSHEERLAARGDYMRQVRKEESDR